MRVLAAVVGAMCVACSAERDFIPPTSGWQPTLVADIGGSGPADSVLLEQVSGAVRLEDGTLVVGDPLASALKFFDTTGTLLRTIGRHGRGPGEFTTITWLGRCGDRVLVFDRNTGDLVWLTADGEERRRTNPIRVSFVTCAPNGRLAYAAFPRRLPTCDMAAMVDCAPMFSLLALAGRDGEVQDTIGEVFAAELRPLGRLLQFAMTDDALYVGTSESAAVDVYDLHGAFLRTVLLDLPTRAPTAAHYEAALRERVAESPDRDWQLQWIDRMRAIPMPPTMPPYTGLFATETDLVWVVASVPGDSVTWLRPMTRRGVAGPDLLIPRGMRVLDAGMDYVVGTWEDEATGEPHVGVYRLDPRL